MIALAIALALVLLLGLTCSFFYSCRKTNEYFCELFHKDSRRIIYDDYPIEYCLICDKENINEEKQ